VPKGAQDVIQGGVQIVDVLGNDVGQRTVLGLIPNILDGIKVRCVRRKPFDLEPSGAALKQSSCGGTMSRQSVPHEDDTSAQVLMNFAHEPNEIRGSCVVIQQFVVHPQPQRPRCAGDGGDRCNAIASIPGTLKGRMARRRPYPPSQRLQKIPTFVEENQASLTLEALFLVAAKFRDASRRCPPRFVRGPAAPASADSSQAGAATAAHTPHETRRRTVAGSRPALTVRSSHPAHIPNIACREPVPTPICFADAPPVSAFFPHEAWTVTCCRASTPPSTDAPMTRCSPQSQPLPSTTCLSRRAWPRLFDGLRAFRGFLLVSCPNCTEPKSFSIN
jgi:hypothetical protein